MNYFKVGLFIIVIYGLAMFDIVPFDDGTKSFITTYFPYLVFGTLIMHFSPVAREMFYEYLEDRHKDISRSDPWQQEDGDEEVISVEEYIFRR